VAREGPSWQSIAGRQKGIVKLAALAITNGHAVNEQPCPGEPLEIVAEQ
jgi:hypothetical protein